jgi:hypothetical protein
MRRRFNVLNPRIILADGQARPALAVPRQNGAIGPTRKKVMIEANRDPRWLLLAATARLAPQGKK